MPVRWAGLGVGWNRPLVIDAPKLSDVVIAGDTVPLFRGAKDPLGLDVRTEAPDPEVRFLAHRIRHQHDKLKLERVANLERIAKTADGARAVFTHLPLWEDGLNLIVSEAYDVALCRGSLALLVRAYAHHFDDDTGELAVRVKNAAALAIADVLGPSMLRDLPRFGASESLTQAIFRRAEALGHPATRVPAPMIALLDRFGVDGSGTRVAVIDVAERDERSPMHMSHTSYIAHPAPLDAGSALVTYGLSTDRGPALVKEVIGAIEEATRMKIDVLSMSLGIAYEGGDRDDYLAAARGDEQRAREAYLGDMKKLHDALDAFPGLFIVAAGNGAASNDFGRHQKVLVAGGLDDDGRSFLSWSSPPPPGSAHLGITTNVLARDRFGTHRALSGQTSWAAPQAAYYAAAVLEAAKRAGRELNGAALLKLLLETARPIEGGFALDPIAAAQSAAQSAAHSVSETVHRA